MKNEIYDKLINELTSKFKENLTDEQYAELFPIFIEFINTKYGNMLEVIRDENNSFYQNAIRNECLKICNIEYLGKKSLLVRDAKLIDLSKLSTYVFNKAKSKVEIGANTLTKEEANIFEKQAIEFHDGVQEYNKEEADYLLSEMVLDLIYCYSDVNTLSFRLAELVSMKEKSIK